MHLSNISYKVFCGFFLRSFRELLSPQKHITRFAPQIPANKFESSLNYSTFIRKITEKNNIDAILINQYSMYLG